MPDEFADHRRCRTASWRPTWRKRGIAAGALAARRRHRSSTSTWRTRWSAATRPRRWRCAARSRWPTTSTREIRLRAPRPGDPGAVADRAADTTGYDPAFKQRDERLRPARAPRRCSTCTATSTATATAGASMPDGTPLVLRVRHAARRRARASSTSCGRRTWTRSACASSSRSAKWPEQPEGRRAGKLMMWGVGWSAGDARRRQLPGAAATAPTRARPNHARFDLPAFDALYERSSALPDGPERAALMRRGQAARWSPTCRTRSTSHRIVTDLAQPWVVGYRRTVFVREFWHYVDIDTAKRERAQ